MIREEYIYPGAFSLECGSSLEELSVTYHRSDIPYSPGSDSRKVVWICHAFTANSDPQDWWPELVGPGKVIDPDRYFVVCVNMLGSPYGTTSPASIKPGTDRPYFLDFPRITVRDIVNVNISVRKHLGVDRIDLMIEVDGVEYSELRGGGDGESSAAVKERVERARAIQRERFEGRDISTNSQMNARDIAKWCAVDENGERILKKAFDKMGLTARATTRILKVARTIADLAGEKDIMPVHLAEAIQYRNTERKYI